MMHTNAPPPDAPSVVRRVRLTVSAVVAILGALLLLAIVAPALGWSVLVLGIVEGVTEFLPVSSTGHLLVTSDLLNFQNNLGGTFEIFIQLGAVFAVLAYYARDLLAQARALPVDATARRFWFGILIAFLPAAVVGLVLRDWIKQTLFTSPTVIAWSLIVGGMVFLLVERLPIRATVDEVRHISLWQALGIGVVQVLALVPGVSRSGASIIGGLLGGLDRRSATTFSFYLAIPTLGAATVVDLLGSLDQLTPSDIGRLAFGTIVSFIVAWFSIGWLLRYVANHSFTLFAVYRILAGVTLLVLVAAGVL